MKITNEDRMACSAHLSDDETGVVILDQTQLPNRQEYRTLRTAEAEFHHAVALCGIADTGGFCGDQGLVVDDV